MLTSAFINLVKNNSFMNGEVNKYQFLLKTYKVTNKLVKFLNFINKEFCIVFDKIMNDIVEIKNSAEQNKNQNTMEIIQEIKKKIFSLQKEKTELICQNIKNLTTIISKLMKEFEGLNILNVDPKDLVDLLTKIKLFLKLTRLLTEKATEEIKSTTLENEKNLFMMYVNKPKSYIKP